MKIGFLFGAGAEVGYGLPSGGKFALDIFRHDSSESKKEFRAMRDNIDKTTKYASSWLPNDYSNNNISSYGKKVFETIIRDTIEHNRYSIINKLNNFDEFAKAEIVNLEKHENISVIEVFENLLGKSIDNSNMNQVISFVDVFKDGNKIFENNYFSALLEIYKNKALLSNVIRIELGKIIIAILQLQIGALSENLTRKINDSPFAKKDDEIDIFDDLGEIIQLNYQSSGLSGIEYLLEKRKADTTTDEGVVLRFAQCIIESIYASVLDYKSLIDSNWHYLYCPSHEWAKFCKISIFLLTVREYILEQSKEINFTSKQGYYNDLKYALDKGQIEISAIATTNYNTFISDITGSDVIYMNGSTDKWYDPYLNKMGTFEELNKEEEHFLVPLMFTQSGTKPMTSIKMAMEYVDTYKKWKDSALIVIIGFGFNADDEHINGIIRTLVDTDNKKLVVISRQSKKSNDSIEKEIANKLKIKKKDNIKVIQVDENRVSNDKIWTDIIIE